MRTGRAIATTALGLILALSGCESGRATGQEPPTRVILFIGDGVGVGCWTAAAFAQSDLSAKQFRVMGLVDTRSADRRVTDSAAGATAYATGVRTYNGAIGVDVDGDPLVSVLEVARDSGIATGLVATSSVTHATPAAFAAHVPSRSMQWEIARQMKEFGLDVLLGGGRRYFDGAERPDSVDLWSGWPADFVRVQTASGLDSVNFRTTRRLVGLFADEHMPSAGQRLPTLPEMTEAALDVLDGNANGFFLMVEASQPDWRAHDNAPIDVVTAEMLDFDRAIGVGLEFQKRHPETLIVVSADHETGGLAIHEEQETSHLEEAAGRIGEALKSLREVTALEGEPRPDLVDSTGALLERMEGYLRDHSRGTEGARSLVARYTTGGHTAAMIPLFARGPGAERFGGMLGIDRVGQLLKEHLRHPAPSAE